MPKTIELLPKTSKTIELLPKTSNYTIGINNISEENKEIKGNISN